MAESIEVRVPFLDNCLTEYVMGLPSSFKVRNGKKKFILRQALRGIVPDYVLDAKKIGFSVPYSNWLKGPLKDYMQQVLTDPLLKENNIFNSSQINKCINEHCNGKRDFGFLLWKSMHLAIWVSKYNVAT